VSNERLEAELRKIFKADKEFSVQHQSVLERPVLGLRWADWYLATVSYEEGQRVSDDSEVISETLNLPSLKIDRVTRRIGVVCYDNEEHHCTNEIMHIIDYLCSIEGAVVFDPLKNSLWPHPRMDKLQSNSARS